MSLGFGTSFWWVLVLEQWSNSKKSASIMSNSRWFLRMSRIILHMASGITSLPMQEVTQCIAALERDIFCVASTGCHHAHLLCGLAGRHHDLLHWLHRVCSGKLFPGLNLWLAGEWSSDNFILRTRALWKPWTSFPDLSAMSSSRRSLITWSPRLSSGDYDTILVTAGFDMLKVEARQLTIGDYTSSPISFPSVSRCSAQHAYVIACCHVITPGYLVGTITCTQIKNKQPKLKTKVLHRIDDNFGWTWHW